METLLAVLMTVLVYMFLGTEDETPPPQVSIECSVHNNEIKYIKKD